MRGEREEEEEEDEEQEEGSPKTARIQRRGKKDEPKRGRDRNTEQSKVENLRSPRDGEKEVKKGK